MFTTLPLFQTIQRFFAKHNPSRQFVLRLLPILIPLLLWGCTVDRRYPPTPCPEDTDITYEDFIESYKYSPDLFLFLDGIPRREARLGELWASRQATKYKTQAVRVIAPPLQITGNDAIDATTVYDIVVVADDLPRGVSIFDKYSISAANIPYKVSLNTLSHPRNLNRARIEALEAEIEKRRIDTSNLEVILQNPGLLGKDGIQSLVDEAKETLEQTRKEIVRKDADITSATSAYTKVGENIRTIEQEIVEIEKQISTLEDQKKKWEAGNDPQKTQELKKLEDQINTKKHETKNKKSDRESKTRELSRIYAKQAACEKGKIELSIRENNQEYALRQIQERTSKEEYLGRKTAYDQEIRDLDNEIMRLAGEGITGKGDAATTVTNAALLQVRASDLKALDDLAISIRRWDDKTSNAIQGAGSQSNLRSSMTENKTKESADKTAPELSEQIARLLGQNVPRAARPFLLPATATNDSLNNQISRWDTVRIFLASLKCEWNKPGRKEEPKDIKLFSGSRFRRLCGDLEQALLFDECDGDFASGASMAINELFASTKNRKDDQERRRISSLIFTLQQGCISRLATLQQEMEKRKQSNSSEERSKMGISSAELISSGKLIVERLPVFRGIVKSTLYLLPEENVRDLFGREFARAFYVAEINIVNPNDTPILVYANSMRAVVRTHGVNPSVENIDGTRKVELFWATYQPLSYDSVLSILEHQLDKRCESLFDRWFLGVGQAAAGAAAVFVASPDFARAVSVFTGTFSPVFREALMKDVVTHHANLQKRSMQQVEEIGSGGQITRCVFFPRLGIEGNYCFDLTRAAVAYPEGRALDGGEKDLLPIYIHDIRPESVFLSGKRLLKYDALTTKQ